MNPDPGWDLSPHALLRMLTPFRSLRRSTAAGETALVGLRNVFLSFCIAIALITVVAVVVLDHQSEGDESISFSVTAIVLLGLATLIAGILLVRHLDCASDQALISSYQTRFFLRLALADAATLGAFAIAIGAGPWWVYFFGLPFTIIGFVRLAPTRRNLERDDDDLRAHGCHRSLTILLNSPAATPAS